MYSWFRLSNGAVCNNHCAGNICAFLCRMQEVSRWVVTHSTDKIYLISQHVPTHLEASCILFLRVLTRYLQKWLGSSLYIYIFRLSRHGWVSSSPGDMPRIHRQPRLNLLLYLVKNGELSSKKNQVCNRKCHCLYLSFFLLQDPFCTGELPILYSCFTGVCSARVKTGSLFLQRCFHPG